MTTNSQVVICHVYYNLRLIITRYKRRYGDVFGKEMFTYRLEKESPLVALILYWPVRFTAQRSLCFVVS